MTKVECSAIGGSDIHLYNWDFSTLIFHLNVAFPFLMGHEMAGTIVAVGDKVSKSRIG
jgi:threonine 3-dehydrogenase